MSPIATKSPSQFIVSRLPIADSPTAAPDPAGAYPSEHRGAGAAERAFRQGYPRQPDVPVRSLGRGQKRSEAGQNHHAPGIRQSKNRPVPLGNGRFHTRSVVSDGRLYPGLGF